MEAKYNNLKTNLSTYTIEKSLSMNAPYHLEPFNYEKYAYSVGFPRPQYAPSPLRYNKSKPEDSLESKLKRILGQAILKVKSKPKYKNPSRYTPEQLERMKRNLGIEDKELEK
jgi:hypothetical protein